MKTKTLILCLFLLIGGNLMAQTISSSQGGGTYIQFNNQNDLNNGGTSLGNIQIGFSLSSINIPNWKLTVQVTSPISVNGTTLDPQYVSIKHNPSLASSTTIANAIKAPANYIAMSFNEVTLISSSAYPLKSPPDYYFSLKYDLRIAGGPQLVELQNGDYPCVLIFRLYDGNGVLKSSSSTTYGFGKYFQGTGGGGSTPILSLTLVNGASNVGLTFTGGGDYVNGVSTTINNGLRAQSTNPYQIKVKSSGTNFSSSQSSTIPVSAVKLLSSKGNPAPTDVTYNGTISLDNIAKTILVKTGYTDPNPVYYNLKYSTTPNDATFKNAQSGTYTTTLTYSLEPN